MKTKKILNNLHQKGGIFMFLRAQLSSGISSSIDFLITIVLAKVFGIYYVYSTFIGSVCGGIVNCSIGYLWTFKSGAKKRYVIVKYLMVWIGSICFNTYGTYLATESLKRSIWASEFFGIWFNDVFIVSKVLVSIIIGWIWNYNMERIFVFRDHDYRKLLTNK
ncbi:MAG: GtrA family protein [Candidatus Peribacteria bacterium]|jgi:putative flippase GtrA|nr:GtrA family protein [Candidatus Peribacteria bacterium]